MEACYKQALPLSSDIFVGNWDRVAAFLDSFCTSNWEDLIFFISFVKINFFCFFCTGDNSFVEKKKKKTPLYKLPYGQVNKIYIAITKVSYIGFFTCIQLRWCIWWVGCNYYWCEAIVSPAIGLYAICMDVYQKMAMELESMMVNIQ